jgi:hypothetical protein
MHVSLTYVYMCDGRLVHAIFIGPGHGLVHRHGLLTLAEILDLLVEIPLWVYRSVFHGKVGPTFVFHLYMSKTNQKKAKGPLVRPRTEKALGVDLRTPRSMVSPDKDHRSIRIPQKLACMCT